MARTYQPKFRYGIWQWEFPKDKMKNRHQYFRLSRLVALLLIAALATVGFFSPVGSAVSKEPSEQKSKEKTKRPKGENDDGTVPQAESLMNRYRVMNVPSLTMTALFEGENAASTGKVKRSFSC